MTDSELLTVSLGTWMELPNLSMKDWRPDVIKSVGGRINVSTVAAYYKGNLLMGIDILLSAAYKAKKSPFDNCFVHTVFHFWSLLVTKLQKYENIT